jgi:hypothetical protein
MSKVRSSSWMRLVSAVLVAVMATGTVGVGVASAEHVLLYPLIVKGDPGMVTLVTYIGPNYNSEDDLGLHYQYNSKLTSAAATAACSSYSVTGASSVNDVLTYDATGALGHEPLFNDDTSDSFGGLGLNLVTAGPSLAYLTITEQGEGQPSWGEAQIVDLTNGGMWGYNATTIPNNDDGTGIGSAAALISATRRPVHLYPPTVATTRFTVTPLGTAMSTNSTNRSAVQLQLSNGAGGVYDRNENPLDFVMTGRVRCVGVLGYADLISASALANPVWSVNGGWAWFANKPSAAVDPVEVLTDVQYDQSAMVFKVLSAGSGASSVVDGQPIFSSICGKENQVANDSTTTSCGLVQ